MRLTATSVQLRPGRELDGPISNRIPAAVVAVSVIAMSSSAAVAQDAFQGGWKVRSTAGQLFEITLSADGTAKASLRNDMTGNWKEEGQRRGHLENRLNHKHHQEGDHYKQSAYRKGKSLDGTNNTSEEK
jgi:hypothetical protein